MRSWFYELYKLINRKVIITLIPLLFISNGLMYVQQQFKQHQAIIEHRDQYTAYEAPFLKLPIEQAYQLAIENRDRLSGFQTYLSIQHLQDEYLLDIYKANANYQKYGHLFPESEYWNNEALLKQHFAFNQAIIEHLEALLAYPEYVSQIESHAKNMLRHSIFNDPDRFSIAIY